VQAHLAVVNQRHAAFGKLELDGPACAGLLAGLILKAALAATLAVDALLVAEKRARIELGGALIAAAYVTRHWRGTEGQNNERKRGARRAGSSQRLNLASKTRPSTHGSTS
jgi:hypothetical protein